MRRLIPQHRAFVTPDKPDPLQPARAVGKVAQASSPASWPGVPPRQVPGPGGGTPLELAGEDACATHRHWPTAAGPSSQVTSPEPPQAPPAFECLGHPAPAWYHYGVGSVLQACCPTGVPYKFHKISLVFHLYPGRNFGSLTVAPPSPSLVLTALAWPTFKGSRILP